MFHVQIIYDIINSLVIAGSTQVGTGTLVRLYEPIDIMR